VKVLNKDSNAGAAATVSVAVTSKVEDGDQPAPKEWVSAEFRRMMEAGILGDITPSV
jgi:hypothetical protein